MTYSEKLRSPLWQKKRLQILERDNWKCCACGNATRNLQVHHLIYCKGSNPWDYADDVYQTLCEECHLLRGEAVDKIVAAIRMSLKDIPHSRLEVIAQRLMAEAMEGMGQ